MRWWTPIALGLLVRTAGADPVPCPDVRLVADTPLGTARLAVVDPAGMVTLPGFCEPTLGRWRSRPRGGAVLRAVWPVCGAATRVHLRLRYPSADCATVAGMLKVRGARRQRFSASPSRCGDDYLDLGESCELSSACATPGTGCVDCSCTPGGGTTTTTTPGGTTTTTLAGLFEASNPWNTDVTALPPATASASIIGALAGAGGWGTGASAFQIDFSMRLLHAVRSTPFLTFAQKPGYYTPDCDAPFPFPLPAGGGIEGGSGYSCTPGGDCHLLVVDAAAKRLYEIYQGNLASGVLSATCGLFWDLTRSYPANLRGEQCTSADAAGLPIGALLFTADEVAAGDIPHALRLILPNNRMRAGVYVHPASHAGSPSGGANLPPYGARFRLRADFDLTPYGASAQVILRAMQHYGLFLADGGNVPLTGADDADTTHTWAELGIDSHALFGVTASDMEIVDLGPTIPLTYDCVRNP